MSHPIPGHEYDSNDPNSEGNEIDTQEEQRTSTTVEFSDDDFIQEEEDKGESNYPEGYPPEEQL